MSDEQDEIEDGFGGIWKMCDRVNCGLQVVRPGKVQCWCDGNLGPFFLGSIAALPPVGSVERDARDLLDTKCEGCPRCMDRARRVAAALTASPPSPSMPSSMGNPIQQQAEPVTGGSVSNPTEATDGNAPEEQS